ncbi:hypothetical protein [Williamsia sp. R60]
MTSEYSTLVVGLEEVGARRWWAALLATLASQSGNAYMRFVGVVDGKQEYFSATFPVPRTWGSIPPQEAWAPGMTQALSDLQKQLHSDGWQLRETQDDPWRSVYTRA